MAANINKAKHENNYMSEKASYAILAVWWQLFDLHTGYPKTTKR